MAITIPNAAGVTTTEHVPGSPQERFEPSGGSAVRILDVAPWSLRQKAVRGLLGYSIRSVDPVSGQPVIKRFIPMAHPDWQQPLAPLGDTGGPYLWAQRCSLAGIKPEGPNLTLDAAIYDRVRITTEYSTLPYNVLSDESMTGAGWTRLAGPGNFIVDEATLRRFVTRKSTPGADYTTIAPGPQGSSYKYVTPGAPPVTVGIGRMLPNANVQITWYGIPEDCVPSGYVNPNISIGAPGSIEISLGKVNSIQFPPRGAGNAFFPPGAALITGWPIGTLLFMGADLKPFISPFGYRIYDITYTFKSYMPAVVTVQVLGGAVQVTAGHNFVYTANTPANPPLVGTLTPGFYEVSTDGQSNLGLQIQGKNPYDYTDFASLFRPM